MRCPVCRAADNRTSQCRRCKADLSLLVELERQHARHLTRAARALTHGEAADCLHHAGQARALRADAASARLLALGYLKARDFASAWHWYQRAKS